MQKLTIKNTDALIVVDVQNDFCTGGTLAVMNAEDIIPIINNRLIPKFDTIVFTRDWHPENHISFSNKPKFVDGSWPSHCVANTKGSEFNKDLHITKDAIIINKGDNKDLEAYSGFDNTNLANELKEIGISRVFICGLATDYCVKSTAIDAKKNGFATILLEDATRGVDIPSGSVVIAIQEMKNKEIIIANCGDLY